MIPIWAVVVIIFILSGMIIHQWWRYRTTLECNKCLEFYLYQYINKYGQSFEVCEKVLENNADNKE